MQNTAFRYAGRKAREISFPLGGIGAGSIGLAGNGRLVDWEIFNKPNKNSVNGFSHFAVRVEDGKTLLDARVLNGDLPTPYTGIHNGSNGGIGFGPARETMAGLPHFRETTFEGAYPLARVDFHEKAFPGKVSLLAFNPFIPLEDRDSSMPAAFFEFTLTNTTRRALTYAVAGTLANPLPEQHVNVARRLGKHQALVLGTDGVATDDVRYGDLCLATDAGAPETASRCPVYGDTSVQPYWYPGASWFDALEVYWRDFARTGRLPTRRVARGKAGKGTQGTILARVRVPAGATRRVRFVIAWNFPNRVNDWHPQAAAMAAAAGVSPKWRNYYATIWRNSAASARYALANWDRLQAGTEAFQKAMLDSTLPHAALDAVSANLSILKSATVMRLEDGTFYGFEGCNAQSGSCEGTCTHVWNYAQALPFLFPALERTVREADYRYNQQADGGMPFRLMLPLGVKHPGGSSCADGLFGNVMMVYRDWKISGDTAWLRAIWPRVKKSIAYAWHPGNKDRWDPERTGVLWGRMHHTLDMELFGPSGWLCGFYLGALKAAGEMAGALGAVAEAGEYKALFEKGKRWVDAHLFNGEYYAQKVDLRDRALVASFGAEGYWNREHGEIKYQIGEGCAIDQVLAQWHANLYGLGDLLEPGQVARSLRSIYAYNYKKTLRGHFNPCRLYGLNDEAGAVICEWPEGRRRPAIPVPYAQETMHGFEYAAAGQMIQNGMVREGMALVKAVRDRYDGERRNPWNEFECGSNYARSMASYALLNAFSGFQFDMTRGMIGFAPVKGTARPFRCFWSLAGGWGQVEITKKRVVIRVVGGRLGVKVVRVAGVGRARTASWRVAVLALDGLALHHPIGAVTATRQLAGANANKAIGGGSEIGGRWVGGEFVLGREVVIGAGEALELKIVD